MEEGNLNYIADSYGAPLYPLPPSISQHLHLPHIYLVVCSVSLLKLQNFFIYFARNSLRAEIQLI